MKLVQKLSVAVITTMAAATLIYAEGEHDMHGDHSKHKMEAKSEMNHDMSHSMVKMDATMKSHMNKVYDTYLSIATSLAGDDFAQAQVSVKTLVDLGKKSPKHEGMEKHHMKMKGLIQKMSEAKDIETLRNQFQTFSKELIPHMTMNSSVLKKEVKVFYCPMKKASWLQDNSQVKNPYYGSKMLACGGEQK